MRGRMTPETMRQIKRMLAFGARYPAIAKATGYSKATIGMVARDEYLPPNPEVPSIEDVLGPVKCGGGAPTQEEIAEACAKLQRYRRREEREANGWTPPVASVMA